MSHYKKLYDKIKNNPKDVSFEELDKLLTKVGGFSRRNPNGGSSHYIFYHPDLEEHISIKKDNPVKVIYVKKALELFEIVREDLW
jgi:poly-D-alanine transfer protein DltD